MNKKVMFLAILAIVVFPQLPRQQSVGSVDNPLSVKFNPGGLAFNNHFEVMLFGLPNSNVFIRNWEYVGYFEQKGNRGFGYEWSEGKNIWSQSFGFKIGKSNALGINYAFDNSRWKLGRLDFGWMNRYFHFLSIGIKLGNVWAADDEDMSVNAGFALQDRRGKYGFGVDAIIDYLTAETISSIYSVIAFAEPIAGLRLSVFSDLFDKGNPNIGLTLGFSFSSTGFEINQYKQYKQNKQHNNYLTYGIRFSKNPYRTILNKIFKPKLQKKYIRMELKGYFIEEPEVKKSNFDFFTFQIPNIPFINGGEQSHGRQLKKFIDEINKLTADDSVEGLIFDLGNVRGGLSKISEIRDSFQRFHNTGKKIIVYSKFGLRNLDVYLLSMADEIYVHDQAGVALQGIAFNIEFYRGLLDTLNIVPEVWRISPYKTAGDVFLNKKMSSEMRENYGQLFGSLYEQIVAGIAEGKAWTIEETKKKIDAGPYLLAERAKEADLITGTMYPDEFDEYIKKIGDENTKIVKMKKDEKSYQYGWRQDSGKEKIAVIYGVGAIMTGKSKRAKGASSIMGDETISNAIKQAREDKSIKAIVFRIDSGGGSALASDIIWREVLKTTETDSANIKPFIASMSDVAGSGGYYIACQADKIIAYPTTITGSIGVIGLRLNMSQLKKRFGITIDGFKFGENADFATGHRLETEQEHQRIMSYLTDIYDKFKERVEKGRDQINDIHKLDEIALGRVWTGEDALRNGLVDELGGYYAAIELAKSEAGIEGEVDIVQYPRLNKVKEMKASFGIGGQIENFPMELQEIFELLEIIPVLERDRAQMIMLAKIEIE